MPPDNPPPDPQSDSLLRDAASGDADALAELLGRHRERLRRMVAYRLDARLAAHVDASDIVQEALADAVRKLPDYSVARPLPFYPWLHRLASERLSQARRRYQRFPATLEWPERSATILADFFVSRDPTPGHALVSAEQRQRVRDALARLSEQDHEVLTMRYLEDLSFPEIALILGIAEGAAKMRHLRALRRIRALIEANGSEAGP